MLAPICAAVLATAPACAQYAAESPVGVPVVLAVAPAASSASVAASQATASDVVTPVQVTASLSSSPATIPATANTEQAPAAQPVDAQPATLPQEAGTTQVDSKADSSAAVPALAPAPAQGTGILGLHSDITFSVLSAPRKHAAEGQQPSQDDTAAAAYATQVKRIAGSLQTAARELYPDALKRIGNFDVYVADSTDLSAMSSGTGRIAINAGFARLNPTDDWMAFVIAREMAHVVAGHHDSNAGASLAVSLLMNLVVPGSGLIKSAISFAGSQMASGSGREKQVKEADEVALKLLQSAGYTPKSVALNLRLNPLTPETSSTSWANAFRGSSERLTAAVLPAMAPAAQDAAPVAAVPNTVPAARPLVVEASQSAPPPPALRQTRWQPEELVRARPSGLPGPLMLGGNAVPSRMIE